jgi:hypothetical protein
MRVRGWGVFRTSERRSKMRLESNLKIKTLDQNSHSSKVMISEEAGRYIAHCGVQRNWRNLVE